MTDRNKPGVAFWATVAVLAALLAYPLSYGPWYGLIQHGLMPERVRLATGPLYLPVEWIINNSSGWLNDALWGYLGLWSP